MRFNKNDFSKKPYMRKWDELPGDDERYDPTVIAAWNLRYEDPERFVECV